VKLTSYLDYLKGTKMTLKVKKEKAPKDLLQDSKSCIEFKAFIIIFTKKNVKAKRNNLIN
jgi:hypothetical protein